MIVKEGSWLYKGDLTVEEDTTYVGELIVYGQLTISSGATLTLQGGLKLSKEYRLWYGAIVMENWDIEYLSPLSQPNIGLASPLSDLDRIGDDILLPKTKEEFSEIIEAFGFDADLEGWTLPEGKLLPPPMDFTEFCKANLEEGKTYKIEYTVMAGNNGKISVMPQFEGEFTLDSITCVEVTPPALKTALDRDNLPKGENKSNSDSFDHIRSKQRRKR